MSEPSYRYTAKLAGEIEAHWQDRWETEGTFHAPNPAGPWAEPEKVDSRGEKLFVLDMFPYPSGAGLHVGHPLGYIATDTFARFNRMKGRNVLHALGYDAFGLPAEQYAVQSGQHPRVTTEHNIAIMRRQLRRLGLAHDPRRSVATVDVEFYRWTQWIFLQIFNAWFDEAANKARHIDELVEEFASGKRPTPSGRPWEELPAQERRRIIDSHRLAYLSEAPVNWCPGLGTVLANEEVTNEGRSEIGNFPVFKRNMSQWMLRITAYAERLLADLDKLDWPDKVKAMQRNWIGRSEGTRVFFTEAASGERIEVFTTRPDTLFGATFMVLAPEHHLADGAASEWPEGTDPAWTGGHASPAEAVAAYRAEVERRTDADRSGDDKEKTGLFTGRFAINPVNGQRVPIFIADYVTLGYGTGAVMAVPSGDQRDWEFAKAYNLPIVETVIPCSEHDGNSAWTGDGEVINSANPEISLNGMNVSDAKTAITEWLEAKGLGEATVNYRLRDWLFSRQRYWGEPFPIVYDETGLPLSLIHI